MSLFYIPRRKQDILLRIVILSLIYVLAFCTRLFSVLRFESVIHEFDPYFNFRSAKYLVDKGWYEFYNWFDDFSWYPLGRVVGGTVYPGIQITAAVMYWALRALNLTVDLRNVCVLTSPFFASNTALTTYHFTKEIKGPSSALIAAAFIGIVPGYISRSVAGSFDNEGVAIFALLATFWLFVKSVRTGSLYWSVMACLAYFYMVNAWGGYVFIINLVPIYVLVLVVTGRFSSRLYVAYSTFYILGTLLAMQVRFVSFLAVQSSEHMASLAVFVLIQVVLFVNWVRSLLDERLFSRLFSLIVSGAGIAGVAALVIGSATGLIAPWTGRFYTMLDPTYAKKHIPIIASVSEHQPTTWASFFFDLHILTILFPVGLYVCFRDLTEASIFLILYGMLSVYFSGVMVRLMLVLAPAACMLSAIGISSTLKQYMRAIKVSERERRRNISTPSNKNKTNNVTNENNRSIPAEIAYLMIAGITFMFVFYTIHCTWVTSEAYSSPSIVLAARGHQGQRIIFDDFREAYYWLSENTPENAKVMSWWDYGYQITAMANRTVMVDNNTWNNTHIATVGRAMASNEADAYKIMKFLDVDYVLVIFGGVTGYASDDINKFLWMVRIGGSVYPSIRESDYLNNGNYRIDAGGSATMLDSLMYKCSYYRFGEMKTDFNQPAGFDRVRHVEIGKKDFKLEYVEEAFTSEHFIVRIFKVKKDYGVHKNRASVDLEWHH
ncbi:oligosaccharide transferase STT3 subunit [Acrasis kona]|uniref:dolichyl-diphosphooligosaccharide--protein glycotransferase n=1 Tax=Acrasis kona TaxID=1008807 RepID=A0AAW2YW62_9EUKA